MEVDLPEEFPSHLPVPFGALGDVCLVDDILFRFLNFRGIFVVFGEGIWLGHLDGYLGVEPRFAADIFNC